MKIYYCVHAEFYDYGKAKACVTSKQAKAKPKNQLRRVYGMIAFKLWITSKERASALCEMVKNGEVYIDDLISFYEDCLPLEGRVA
jgi:hypothetical protein